MDRIEKTGLGVALVGHIALVLLVTLSLTKCQPTLPVEKNKPIQVSLAEDVGLHAQAPQAVTPPAQSSAPDVGAPEDAPPPAPQPAKQPDPTPPAPQPEPAPAPRSAPKAPPQPQKKPTPPAPEKAKTPKRETTPPAKLASNAKSAGSAPGSTGKRQRASLLGADFEKGLSATPTQSKSTAAQGPVMSQQAMMDIGSKIIQQVQPCANRQVKPGPGAERIRVTIRLRLNRDGSLAANPQVIAHDGVDDENSRYADRVDDNAIATFKGCSPLRGLPLELYDVPHGWSNFSLRYKLPG